MTDLRDHDQDCSHGNTREHYDPSCPGGREITIDYEAAWDAANQPHGFDTESRVSIGRRRLHASIDAAIGDIDDNGCLLCGEDIVHSGPHYFGETIE